MNFLVIGHSVVDNIIEETGTSTKPGGIFYSVISLLSQLEKEDRLFLCSSIDKSSAKLFEDYYQLLDKRYISEVETIPQVELVIDGYGERKEKYSLISQNLSVPIESLNQFDGILINMISGYDISLDQLKQIRKKFKGLIYFDVHTLSRGVDKNLSRKFRKINDFREWADCINILQANESELLTLSAHDDERLIGEELLSSQIEQIIITRAEKGATVFFREAGVIKSIHKEALKVNLINKVGCGDVFGAVYFYNYIKNKNVFLVLDQANLFAGISATYTDTNEFLNLKIDANKYISKK